MESAHNLTPLCLLIRTVFPPLLSLRRPLEKQRVLLLFYYPKYVYIKSTTVYTPSSELGLYQPLSRQRVCPSPQSRGRRHTRLRVRGWGSPNPRLEKKFSTLPTLWFTVKDRYALTALTGCIFMRHIILALFTVSQAGPIHNLYNE